MSFDGHANFAQSLIAVAPSPGISGLTLTVTAGQGAIFPATPFNATVQPIGVIPTTVNSEIVRVTNITGDVLTIVRAQEGTTGLNITTGYQIGATVTAKAFTDIETAVTGVATTSTPLNSFAAPTGNVGMGGKTFTSLNSVSAAPSGTSTVGLVVNNPSGTSVDVADFQINGVTQWNINSTGTLGGIGQLNLSPTSTSISPLLVNVPSGSSANVATFRVNSSTAWSIGSAGTLAGTKPITVSPTLTTSVAATFNNPASTSADVADFQINGVTAVSVNSSGNLAVSNSGQLDLSAASATAPIIGTAWNAFTPGWTTSGTAPAIGNGTIVARYMKLGRVVTFNIMLTPGTTTTFGTGTLRFNIPVAAASNGVQYVECLARPAGGCVAGVAEILSGGTTIDQIIVPSSVTSMANSVALSATAPATFAATASNYITISGQYESAS